MNERIIPKLPSTIRNETFPVRTAPSFARGYAACWNGIPIQSCPYPDHVGAISAIRRADLWVKGWIQAHDDNYWMVGAKK